MYTAINMCPARKPIKPIKYKNKVMQLKDKKKHLLTIYNLKIIC